jgi:hypothetical protein
LSDPVVIDFMLRRVAFSLAMAILLMIPGSGAGILRDGRADLL